VVKKAIQEEVLIQHYYKSFMELANTLAGQDTSVVWHLMMPFLDLCRAVSVV